MRPFVEQTRCQGHGRCYSGAPELFDPVDDFGHAEAVGGQIITDDPVVAQRVRRAADACPERAITVLGRVPGEDEVPVQGER